MLVFKEDKKVIVKRYSTELGAYNRPQKTAVEVGTYLCHIAGHSSKTAQLQPQKKVTTDFNLFVEPEADIQKGDILYIYEMDEYENIIPSTEFKALADRPYKKRTFLAVPLLSEEEV
jgi:hypothetical protein